MTGKQFFDWQTSGGTDDVMRLIDCLERADVPWCCIGGIAVNHWAEQPMVTRDVDVVIALDEVERVVRMLEGVGFRCERVPWSVNLQGRSAVSIQVTTEDFYRDFPGRAVPADVHGILMRVAALDDTLAGKIKAWAEPTRRQSKQAEDFTDIVRLVEAHPHLWARLPADLQSLVHNPADQPRGCESAGGLVAPARARGSGALRRRAVLADTVFSGYVDATPPHPARLTGHLSHDRGRAGASRS